MARHASGKNNLRLAGWLIALLVALAVAAVLAVVLWQRDGADSSAAAPDCVSGDLVLPVAASDEKVGRALIDDYAAANPVVRDYCIKPQYVDSIKEAAVYIAPNTSITHTALKSAERTAAVADPQAVHSEPVGVAGTDQVKLEDVKTESVLFPVEEEPEASALVAAKVAGNDNDAVKALTDQRLGKLADFAGADGNLVATAEDSVPEGLSFTPVGADIVYAAIPLNQNDAVNEDQARAGQDFARAAAEKFDGSEKDQPVISDLVWAAALPSGGEKLGDQAEAAKVIEPVNTLFLLDTSEAMAPFIEPAKDAIGNTALELAGAGKEVGLWNYSSPLTPGVVNGFRQNISVSPDAESVNVAVRRFLVGGVPQTREALQAAAAAYGNANAPMRIVLVTTGTADAGDDAAFIDGFRQAAGNNLDLTVVRVGEGDPDAALEQIAQKQVDAKTAENIADAVKQAAGF